MLYDDSRLSKHGTLITYVHDSLVINVGCTEKLKLFINVKIIWIAT